MTSRSDKICFWDIYVYYYVLFYNILFFLKLKLKNVGSDRIPRYNFCRRNLFMSYKVNYECHIKSKLNPERFRKINIQ